MSTLVKESGSGCVNFRQQGLQRKVIWDKEGHHILVNGLVLQEDKTILNGCVPNSRVSNDARHKQNCKEKQMNSLSWLETPLSEMDRFSRQKVRKDLVELNHTRFNQHL